MAEEVAGDVAEVVLLFAVDGGFGGLDGAGGASFYLDEAEDVVVLIFTLTLFPYPANEVEFAAVVGRTEVAGDDGVAMAAQVEVGGFFATTSGLEMAGGFVRREELGGKPVERAERGLGETAGEHSSA